MDDIWIELKLTIEYLQGKLFPFWREIFSLHQTSCLTITTVDSAHGMTVKEKSVAACYQAIRRSTRRTRRYLHLRSRLPWSRFQVIRQSPEHDTDTLKFSLLKSAVCLTIERWQCSTYRPHICRKIFYWRDGCWSLKTSRS
jgi:hypothetical protein